MSFKRRYPIGAEIISKGGVHFRIWAPDHKKATVVLEKKEDPLFYPMTKEKGGYFSVLVPEANKDTLYRFKLDNSERLFSDPASRFQPAGPNGPSCVIDSNYPWTDDSWKGITKSVQIIYEMHIGTFTEEGTFKGAMDQLEELADLGITIIEIMPLNDFPGHYGWGYDGVNLYAPCRLYGHPNHLKGFIDKAHRLNLSVILDVVYNHLGPEDNQLGAFTQKYFNNKYDTDWGMAINFDNPSCREFFLTNAKYWIEEFHFDGLRVDATSCFFSSTPIHILADLTHVVKNAGGERQTLIIGENEPQNSDFLKPIDQGGYGFDALWNDDFHHTAHVRLTGQREAYYTDYLGTPQEFISSLKYGFLYQGQFYDWQKKERGVPNLNIAPESLVIFLENHDQVANSGHGKRLYQLSDHGNYKALTCLLLLSPNTPMLFQGQEFGSSHPFYYFADHSDSINLLVKEGRKESLAQFPRLATREARRALTDPSNPLTFTKCKLDFTEREKNVEIYILHRDLIKLRREDSVFKNLHNIKFDGAVIGRNSFLLRYFGDNEDRLIIINFGADHHFNPAPEPLLVAPRGYEWETLWSSESVIYGGDGIPPINIPYWKVLGHSATVLKTRKKKHE